MKSNTPSVHIIPTKLLSLVYRNSFMNSPFLAIQKYFMKNNAKKVKYLFLLIEFKTHKLYKKQNNGNKHHTKKNIIDFFAMHPFTFNF